MIRVITADVPGDKEKAVGVFFDEGTRAVGAAKKFNGLERHDQIKRPERSTFCQSKVPDAFSHRVSSLGMAMI